MFCEYDKDHSGSIDKQELSSALTALGLRLNRPELDAIMAHLDTDGGGDIDLSEFIANFKQERVKRFDGYIPELKKAKELLLERLRSGDHAPNVYRLLATLERLQSLTLVSPEEVSVLRSYVQVGESPAPSLYRLSLPAGCAMPTAFRLPQTAVAYTVCPTGAAVHVMRSGIPRSL
jgi:hypothetical protein